MNNASTENLIERIRREGKQVGDVIRVGGKPHYLYSINPDHVTLVSMDERKMLVTLWDKRDGS